MRIHQNFLSTDRDWRVLRAGVELVRNIGRQSPLMPFVKEETGPGAGVNDVASIDEHIKKFAITVHHPLGTCKMGLPTDPGAVVDDQLRVLGVERLRVVDASVMPDLVGGNINASVVMIAERAADLIRGRTPLPAATVSAKMAAG